MWWKRQNMAGKVDLTHLAVAITRMNPYRLNSEVKSENCSIWTEASLCCLTLSGKTLYILVTGRKRAWSSTLRACRVEVGRRFCFEKFSFRWWDVKIIFVHLICEQMFGQSQENVMQFRAICFCFEWMLYDVNLRDIWQFWAIWCNFRQFPAISGNLKQSKNVQL